MHKLTEAKRNLYLLIILVVLFTSLIGFSYSAYKATYETVTQDNIIKSGDLSIKYTSGRDEINLTTTYPVDDAAGFNTDPYTFSIENTGDYYITYYISFDSSDSNYTTEELSHKMNRRFIRYSFNQIEALTLPANIEDEIYSSGLAPGETDNLDFRLWIDNIGNNKGNGDANHVANLIMKGKLKVTYVVAKFTPKVRLYLNNATIVPEPPTAINIITDQSIPYQYDGNVGYNGDLELTFQYVHNFVRVETEIDCYGYDTENVVFQNLGPDGDTGFDKDVISFYGITKNTTCKINYTNNLATVIRSKVGTENIQEFIHERTSSQPYQHSDYRYAWNGINDDNNIYNNYIRFNDEVWRIIGVFPVNIGLNNDEQGSEYLVKIIKNDYLTYYNASGTNMFSTFTWHNNLTENITNIWDSSLMKELLNGAYLNKTSVTKRVYNMALGALVDKTFNFTTTGIGETARNMISSANYYLGGAVEATYADDLFVKERSAIPVNTGERNENATVSREDKSISYSTKIGLLNVSDYGYASGKYCADAYFLHAYSDENWEFPDDEQISLNGEYYQCVSPNYNHNWLYKNASQLTEWTITQSTIDPSDMYTEFKNVFYIDDFGNVNTFIDVSTEEFYIRPVLYLKSNVKYQGGNGSYANPYLIGQEA